MRTVAVAFVLSGLCSVVLTPLVRDLAHRFGWLDHALTSRKIHGKPIPRLGGLAIAAAFYAPLVGLLLVDSGTGRAFWARPREALGLFFGGVAIVALGVWDDVRGISASKKLLAQLAVAYTMYQLGFQVNSVALPFGAQISLGAMGLPFTVLWIVGAINAMNLIDGLDGLAGGVAVIAVASTFAIAFQRDNTLMLLFSASLSGAVLGFLRYNFNPASIFMGDAGSMFLGFVFATSAIQTNQKSSTAVAMLTPIVALGLPIGDTLVSMTRRALRGVPMFRPDKGHIHHRLLAKGLSHRQAVLVLYGVCAVLSAAAVVLSRARGLSATMVLLGVGVFVACLLHWTGYLRLQKTNLLLEERRRNLQNRASIQEISDSLGRARQLYDVWKCVRQAALTLGASGVELKCIHCHGSERATKLFSRGFDRATGSLLRARYSLLGERPDSGYIELGWDDGRRTVSTDIEISIGLICEQVLAAINRILLLREQEEVYDNVVSLRR